ncbi:efflux RND transporter permease subunit [Neotabrizicola shimadae]|uniref:Efflux pump membrane transporter n=1 Tax=Neotabrizicola shimadae TaxID=2807096 RepID=A0A8G0ZVV4_9RHOB|nr:efflux RND transporter permease subunit [Neotabrizicola shimadae]QYZ69623.1 efflux RND transporter permease subunit [Neotabrizicola shimadae]
MLSAFFIRRPIFSTVLALIIVLIGGISTTGLPVEQYPAISPVQINVTTVYYGADAETVAESVAAPIEAQINGVENMLYMTSTSSASGQMSISVYFDATVDPDIAQVLVQNRVDLALPRLPKPVAAYGVSVQQVSSSVMMLVAITAEDGLLPLTYVTDYANVIVLDAIQKVNGAGQASMFGDPNQAMRVWLNPARMASLGVTATDVSNAIALQNQLVGAGEIGAPPGGTDVQQTFPMTVEQQLTEPEQYDDLILRADEKNGAAILRLGDVARTELGFEQYLSNNTLNGELAALVVVYQQPGANGIEVSNNVRATLESLKANFPPGLNYVIALDTTDFVRLSIRDVINTLFVALGLVMVVMYLFLQSLRATAVAAAAIVISIVGTFAGMLALGFSINLLTLFGLVLAIGLVVDDAIVVIENATRNIEESGASPSDSVIKAMGEVTGPVVATVLVLCSVFIPAAFIGGPTGALYQQFAITIAVSVTISGIVALSITPSMAALLLRPGAGATRGPFALFNRAFKAMERGYGRLIGWVIKLWYVALVAFAAIVWAAWSLFQVLPTSFVPMEDQGFVLAAFGLPDSASLGRTDEVGDQVDAIFAKDPAVEYRVGVTGYSLVDSQYLQNFGTYWVKLKDFDQRTTPDLDANSVIARFMEQSRSFTKAMAIAVSPPAIPGFGTQSGFNFWIQATGTQTPADLEKVTTDFIAEARKRPEITGLSSTFRASGQQLKLDIDRDKVALLGVDMDEVYQTLQIQFGSASVSQFTEMSRVWNVIVQADAPYRDAPSALENLYVRNRNGAMVPLNTFISTRYEAGPTLVPHFDGFPAAQITGQSPPGYSSGQSIAAMQEVATTALPQGYTYGWSGLAYSQTTAGNTSALAFGLGMLLVFLILAAQYESWSLPAAVMTAVPFGVFGALVATWLRGLDNDVYFQIGLLLMVGLAAKNGILIVEFAVERWKAGRSLKEAAVEAGELRLRPIIMTSLAFIFGVLPLATATGAGANARHSIGTGIIGGMIGASSLALLFVPMFFWMFESMRKRSPAAGQGSTAAETASDQVRTGDRTE